MNISTCSQNLKYYKKRLQIEKSLEDFLQKKGYLKIHLPVLSPSLIPESYLEIFETEFKYFDKTAKLYLTPSPELFLKRLLLNNIGDCYYLGKSFRNSETKSDLHSFEFTMLEYYKMNADYMDIAEELLHLLQFIAGHDEIVYQGKKISLKKWEKLTIAQAFDCYSGIPEKALFDHKEFLKKAKSKGYTVEGFNYEDIFSQIYTQEIEPHLGNNGLPTVIYDYPKEFAALAKLNKNGKTAQRFEFYIAGIELGDCYTELTDPKENKQRFIEEAKKRKLLKKINHPIDKGMTEELKYNLADCSGIAIGFDRLAMIFADATSIQQLKLINIE